jgi:uncharacterized repeat protein (TIGR04138 family)
MEDYEQLCAMVRKELFCRGGDRRYTLAAYIFVVNGFDYCCSVMGAKRHVSGKELARSLADFACLQFGPLAGQVLRYWGIKATADFGNIVYNLIALGFMQRRTEDRLEDFSDCFNLDDYCGRQDWFKIDKHAIRTIQGA